MDWICSMHGRDDTLIQILVTNPERQILRGTPRRRLKDNMKMDLWKQDFGENRLAEDGEAVVSTVMNLWVTQKTVITLRYILR